MLKPFPLVKRSGGSGEGGLRDSLPGANLRLRPHFVSQNTFGSAKVQQKIACGAHFVRQNLLGSVLEVRNFRLRAHFERKIPLIASWKCKIFAAVLIL